MLEKLKNNTDVIYKKTRANCIIIYQEHLCNILEFMKDFYPKMERDVESELDEMFPGICKNVEANEAALIQLIFSGLLVAKRNHRWYVFDLSKTPSRPTSDSIAEPENVMGSRDGFVENFKENIALMRTRIKDDSLCIDQVTIGRRSKTIVSVLSIKDIHNEKIKKNILDKLNSIDIDAIISLEDLMAYFQKNHFFPSYHYIGNPDTACRRLYNGEFVMIIDRICVVIGFPTTLSYTSRLKVDGINLPFFALFERIFILLSVFFSIFFCGLLCAFSTTQRDCLSFTVLSTLKVSQMGIFLPIFIEILIVVAMFELYYLIGFRQSKLTVSSTIVLIGGLIIGQNLISSGVAGVFIITATAISYLLSFVVSSNVNTVYAISIARLFILVSSLLYGLFGVLIASIILCYFLYKQTTLGVPYFYPFMPFNVHDIHKFFIASSDLKLSERDKPLKIKNFFRRKE